MNRNTLYAGILAEELARAGVREICISPGSRNTPLVLAFASRPEFTVTSHLDERSAAFFALGAAIGSADRMPAVLVCTSGSAAANYFPAIVEAHQAHVPLIVLTADRPPELRHSGANQTMDQVKLYGGYALWSVDASLPEAVPSAPVIRNLRGLAARAVAVARGEPAGVAHINLPFRPPLEPTDVTGDSQVAPMDAQARAGGAPFVIIQPEQSRRAPAPALVERLAGLIGSVERGLIVCGPAADGAHDGAGRLELALREFAARAGYPVVVDGVSGLRFGLPGAVGGYDTFLSGPHGLPGPELVLRLGAVPTSKWLNQYLDQSAPQHYIQISEDGVWADDSHRLSELIPADPAEFFRRLTQVLPSRTPSSAWARDFERSERVTWAVIERELESGPWFDGGAAHDMAAALPEGASFVVGNSLAVRNLDQFGAPSAKYVFAHANRGVSGIDGNLSTAFGVGHVRRGGPLAALVGDVTFYHDMNGLLAARRCGVPATIVLVNNNGGGIFRQLPVNAQSNEPAFTQHFLTPHDLEFEHAARLYGLDYVRADDRAGFNRAFLAGIAQRQRATLIEVRTDSAADLRRRNQIAAAVHAAVRQEK